VFTRTKHRAKRLAEKLDGGGLFVSSIQGNLSQRRRQEALDGFRRGDVHVLVATDIAARGIDVAEVSHVVNYDVPDTEEAYVHRIGRTGRARHEGDAVTFVTPEDADMVRRIEKVLGERIERQRLEAFDYDVPLPARLDADERRFQRGGIAGGGQRGGARVGGARGGGRGGPSRPPSGGGRPPARASSGEPRSSGGGRPSSGGRPSGGGSSHPRPQVVAPTPQHAGGEVGEGGRSRRRRRSRRGGGAGARD